MGTYLPQLRDNVCIQNEHLEDDRLSHAPARSWRNVQLVLRPRLQSLKESRFSLSIHLPPLFDWHNGNLFNAAPGDDLRPFALRSLHNLAQLCLRILQRPSTHRISLRDLSSQITSHRTVPFQSSASNPAPLIAPRFATRISNHRQWICGTHGERQICARKSPSSVQAM